MIQQQKDRRLARLEEERNKPPVTILNVVAAVLAGVFFRMGSKRSWFVGAHLEEKLVYLYCEDPAEDRDEKLRTVVEEARWEALVQVGRGVYPNDVPDREAAVVLVFTCEEGWLDELTSPDREDEMNELASALEGVCDEVFASASDA
ncbi:hypothetical protein Pla175_43730 [Pirellulimonas nuda]|uniref:Uncharacterized protein n=1 Tax=Pirellulimonas nuda TaxID=2528009 RepID=A0A518DHK9_9BACT|nr:hypothetical protein [Pirellulimonas nuda]QDU90959.1 hypothetical protein Pla175_43730 [Pirellulimonas nuda]